LAVGLGKMEGEDYFADWPHTGRTFHTYLGPLGHGGGQ